MEKTLTWNDIEDGIDNLEEQINRAGIKFDWIVSINRGGLIPGVLLSHRLKIPHGVMTVTHYKDKEFSAEVKRDLYISMVGLFKSYHNILIVDDIADSGICLEESIRAIKKIDPDPKQFCTATLHYKNKSIVTPTFYAAKVENDVWINYPWEIVNVKSGVAV